MEPTSIELTEYVPRFSFNHLGLMVMEGSSITVNSEEVFKPAIKWSQKVIREEVDLLIILEFLNISSLRQIIGIFGALEKNRFVKKVNANWYYLNDDDDMYEKGLIFKELFPSFKFHFIQRLDKSNIID